MKRKSKVIVAFIMTLLLITSLFPTAVFAGSVSNEITGDSTVSDVTVNVILPTTINFALDPLGLKTKGDNQIQSQDYFFVNQTIAPVKVSLALTAKTSGTAVLISDPSVLKKDNTGEDSKKIFFGAIGATGLTGTAITTTTTGISYSAVFTTTGPAAEYGTPTSGSATLVKFTPNSDGTTGAAVIAFALGKAKANAITPTAIDSLADDNKGVAAFQFYSELNTYADWKANDISVSGTYTLTPLRDTTYTGFETVSGGLNQLEPEDVTPPAPTYSSAGFISGSAIVTTIPAITSVSTSAVNITIPFYANGKTATSLVLNSAFTMPTAEYALDTTANTLIVKKDDSNYTFRKAGAGAKTMVLTLSDNSTYTFTINQQ